MTFEWETPAEPLAKCESTQKRTFEPFEREGNEIENVLSDGREGVTNTYTAY